jgi:hypothetical protein
MIRVIKADQKAFNVTVIDIKLWQEKSGKYSTRCIEWGYKTAW